MVVDCCRSVLTKDFRNCDLKAIKTFLDQSTLHIYTVPWDQRTLSRNHFQQPQIFKHGATSREPYGTVIYRHLSERPPDEIVFSRDSPPFRSAESPHIRYAFQAGTQYRSRLFSWERKTNYPWKTESSSMINALLKSFVIMMWIALPYSCNFPSYVSTLDLS